MQTTTLEGVVPILVTPVRRGRPHRRGQPRRGLIDFNIDAGVHGLGVALGSEIFKFNEAERAQVTRVVVKLQRRAVCRWSSIPAPPAPISPSTTAGPREDAGADALMVIPPTFLPGQCGRDRRLLPGDRRGGRHPDHPAGRTAGPDSARPGAAVSPTTAATSRYIKVETLPVTAKVADDGRGRRATG